MTERKAELLREDVVKKLVDSPLFKATYRLVGMECTLRVGLCKLCETVQKFSNKLWTM